MKHLTIALALLFAFALPALAAPGFVEQSLWLSKENPFAGEEVRIYSAVANTGSDELAGDVVFYDGSQELGRSEVMLPAGAAQLVSIAWMVEAGEHAFYAVFEGATGSVVGAQTPQLSRSFVPDTDGDGIGDDVDTDDDGDGIPDEEDDDPLVHRRDALVEGVKDATKKTVDAVKPVVASTAPKVVEALGATVEVVESFRKAQAQALEEKRDEIRERIATAETAVEEGESPRAGSGWGDKLQLAAVSTAGFVFAFAPLFYLVLLAGLYLLARQIIRFFRRRTGADRLAE